MSCNDPDCPVHGDRRRVPAGTLFAIAWSYEGRRREELVEDARRLGELLVDRVQALVEEVKEETGVDVRLVEPGEPTVHAIRKLLPLHARKAEADRANQARLN